MGSEAVAGDSAELRQTLDGVLRPAFGKAHPSAVPALSAQLQMAFPKLADRAARRLAERLIHLWPQSTIEGLVRDAELCLSLHRKGAGMPNASSWPVSSKAARAVSTWQQTRAGEPERTARDRNTYNWWQELERREYREWMVDRGWGAEAAAAWVRRHAGKDPALHAPWKRHGGPLIAPVPNAPAYRVPTRCRVEYATMPAGSLRQLRAIQHNGILWSITAETVEDAQVLERFGFPRLPAPLHGGT